MGFGCWVPFWFCVSDECPGGAGHSVKVGSETGSGGCRSMGERRAFAPVGFVQIAAIESVAQMVVSLDERTSCDLDESGEIGRVKTAESSAMLLGAERAESRI